MGGTKGSAALLASALDDETASSLLSALGISPTTLLSPSSSPESLAATLAKSISTLRRKEAEKQVIPILFDKHQFVRVANPYSTSLTEQTLYSLSPDSPSSLRVYVRTNLVNLQQELLTLSNTWLDQAEQEKAIGTIFSMAPSLSSISRRFFAIAPNLYWDSQTHTLVPQVPTPHRCFIRLFDTPAPSGGVVAFPLSALDETFSALIRSTYTTFLAFLRSEDSSSHPPILSYKDIVSQASRDFRFIEEWADDDPGLYWDLLTLISTVFMEHKPIGAYFLIGLSRNGKSSFTSLLHSIFGTNNTSRTRLSQLGDPHHTAPLTHSILNAPDDEDDDITQYQGAFKELASHSTFNATKLYSSTPIQVDGSHITFVFPVNTLPLWKGTSASACSKRTIPLAFTRTFDASDTSLTSFEQQAFTKDTLGRIVAQAMALATFYQERPECFGYSPTTVLQKQSIQADNDSVSMFRLLFQKYFCGFQNWTLLYDEYCYWCQQMEYRYQQRASLVLCFNDCKREGCRWASTYQTTAGKVSSKCRHLSASALNKAPFMPDLLIPEFKRDVASLHQSGLSVIYQLEEYYDAE